MALDIACIWTDEELRAEIERLQLDRFYEEELDQRIEEYEAKILRLQLKIDDPHTESDKRELYITKIQNRVFAYYTMLKYREGL